MPRKSYANSETAPSHLTIRTVADADRLMELIRTAAGRIKNWIATQSGDPLDMLRRMKFEPVGLHPIEGHALNLVEQINQTWTFDVVSCRCPPASPAAS